jgi:alpha-L-fucosidase
MRLLRHSVARTILWSLVVPACMVAPMRVQSEEGAPPSKSPALQEALTRWQKMRFGMFIHWGPVSLKGTEIGWSRGDQVPVEEYDNLYKKFDAKNFNAEEWVRTAKEAGMKYLVFTTKHHDGFCMWDTKQTDFNVMHSPLGRDVVKELAAACKKEGIAFGAYHSVCDWHNPNFPLGSPGGNTKKPHPDMDAYMKYLRAQVTELIQNYGPLVLMWFDVPQEVGPELGKPLVEMVRSLQPDIIINNRAYADGKDPVGDYDTPEQRIGGFNNTRPWETCMTICEQWAWKPNDHMKSFAQCIQTLVRTAGGDGNLLFNVGPMPDGRIEPRQVERLREMGKWLQKYGESIYDTHGGPFYPDGWGCSTHRGNKVFVHVLSWPGAELLLPPLDQKIVSVRALTGGNATFKQENNGIHLYLPESSRDAVDSILLLEMDTPVKGMAKTKRAPTAFDRGDYGKWLSKDATYEMSSLEPQYNDNENLKKLLSGEDCDGGFAFHTKEETNPYIVIDLGREAVVKGIEIGNRADMGQDRAKTLAVWVSKDKTNETSWRQVWKADKVEQTYEVPVTEFVAGIQQVGTVARYIKIGLQEKNYFHLYSVRVYGDEK